MSKTAALVLAARPKTLPAAICPVVAGSALAWRLEHTFSWLLAVATLLSTIAIQVATNYFNDAVDSAKGADTAARIGPVRATASGLVSRRTMLLAGLGAVLTAALFSIPLLHARGWPILGIGVVSLLFSYGYTGGPWPLAYRGMGELFVILFFGLVAVSGTVFVHTGHWRTEALLAGLQIGSLSTALIAINNLRDIEEDRRTGKRTLAVRTGVTAARMMIFAWLTLPYVAGWFWMMAGYGDLFFYPLPALVVAAVPVIGVFRNAPSLVYNKFLAISALHLLVWTGVFTFACLRG
ncbi:MAG TPA: 1,4-dihydroxy-2-naphthoate octaprenyltransferase [Verrucomicrobiales bacterium]|jgi:1,4-dihydroxy-2-naphthoate octaprenyltransferase|nr:1,4-dihydroxy-2-naphthoate octaprenyltransferase [Verrucomicrobiales bacterium]